MNTDPIIQLLETLKTDIINSLQGAGSDASGQTAKSLTVVQDTSCFQLQLPGYMQLLETGRRPTSANPTAADPPMIDRIQAWCQEKGIPDKAAWAIKKSIDKYGYKGKPGILSEPLGDDNINLRLAPVLQSLADDIGNLLSAVMN